jgi:hypothetical protein
MLLVLTVFVSRTLVFIELITVKLSVEKFFEISAFPSVIFSTSIFFVCAVPSFFTTKAFFLSSLCPEPTIKAASASSTL